jgi:hypothetical protein
VVRLRRVGSRISGGSGVRPEIGGGEAATSAGMVPLRDEIRDDSASTHDDGDSDSKRLIVAAAPLGWDGMGLIFATEKRGI